MTDSNPTDQSSRQASPANPLWAQLAELEARGSDAALQKAAVVRSICEAEQIGLREFARRAAGVRGLDDLTKPPRVSQLLAWAQLVELAREKGVVTIVTTPPEGALRPLFGKRVPPPARLDVLAEVAATGEITSRTIGIAVNARYPKPKSALLPAKGDKRKVIPHLRKLIAEYGLEAVTKACIHLETEAQQKALKEKGRA